MPHNHSKKIDDQASSSPNERAQHDAFSGIRRGLQDMQEGLQQVQMMIDEEAGYYKPGTTADFQRSMAAERRSFDESDEGQDFGIKVDRLLTQLLPSVLAVSLGVGARGFNGLSKQDKTIDTAGKPHAQSHDEKRINEGLSRLNRHVKTQPEQRHITHNKAVLKSPEGMRLQKMAAVLTPGSDEMQAVSNRIRTISSR